MKIHVTTFGPHIVSNSVNQSRTYSNYFPSSTSLLGVGSLRYNPNQYEIEVYDGTSWVPLRENAESTSLSLTDTANAAISWATNKMLEEQKLVELIKNSPAVSAAYDNLKKAEEQLKTTIILSKDEQK